MLLRTLACGSLSSLLLSGFAHSAEETLHLLPEEATEAERLEIANQVRPSKRQLRYQQPEFISFIHLTVNTFTDREWGTGKENPAVFNPTELDADQWVRTIKESGAKMAILTCKHHDGFALWKH